MSFQVLIPPPQRLANPSGTEPMTVLTALLGSDNEHIRAGTLISTIKEYFSVKDSFSEHSILHRTTFSSIYTTKSIVDEFIRKARDAGMDELYLLNMLSRARELSYISFNKMWLEIAAFRVLYATDKIAPMFYSDRLNIGYVGVSNDGLFACDKSGECTKISPISIGRWYVLWVYFYYDVNVDDVLADVYLMNTDLGILGGETIHYGTRDFIVGLFSTETSGVPGFLDVVLAVEYDWLMEAGEPYTTIL